MCHFKESVCGNYTYFFCKSIFFFDKACLISNFSVLRSAKEHILGLSRVGSAGDVEKTDMFLHDSVFEETIIAEYALVINGHSLVRY